MKKIVSILILAIFPALSSAVDMVPDTLVERYSYAIGARLAQALGAQGVSEVDATAFATAVEDVLAGRVLRMSDAEMLAAVTEEREVRAQANAEAGKAYRAQNARRPGVVTLPNGLQYEVLQPGKGAQPEADATVRVHYHGTRIDGAVFDSSQQRGQPAEFPLNGVIAGFRDAITRMRVGGQWRIVVPGELAYGERGAGADIGPNETLVFEISLLEIVR
jgi:FKBP-type peptidyl-prolyl cis-trans isomerase FklB